MFLPPSVIVNSYTLVKKKTYKDHYSELKNITLSYYQDDIYNNFLDFTEEICKRHKGTRLIDCPFKLYIVRDSYSKWHLEVCNKDCNYDHSENMSLMESQQKTDTAIIVTGSHLQEILLTFVRIIH
ncbi:hypothetical protein RhiirA4_473263 [Rhizophagus irregularis]|uniref:Uncharacterized protein n=1 Tax=Rhizophagus irregularis TaxID=588596 RepID=A0A2I1H6D9_9GLOM|nr:hypothetical protein RhiirA4_473263 [Rhizophagus irregularis]